MEIRLDEVVTLDFITNDPFTGGYTNAVDTPLVEVFEEANDANIFYVSADLRSGKIGQYRANINCFANGGFALDTEYSVIASANVNGVLAAGVVAILVPRETLTYNDVNSIVSNVSVSANINATVDWDTINAISSNVNTVLSTGHGAGSWLSGSGGGAIEWSYYITSTVDSSPVGDVDVWITTDITGDNLIAQAQTNALGYALFYLDAGTYYVWRQKSGWTFDNPDTEIVS